MAGFCGVCRLPRHATRGKACRYSIVCEFVYGYVCTQSALVMALALYVALGNRLTFWQSLDGIFGILFPHTSSEAFGLFRADEGCSSVESERFLSANREGFGGCGFFIWRLVCLNFRCAALVSRIASNRDALAHMFHQSLVCSAVECGEAESNSALFKIMKRIVFLKRWFVLCKMDFDEPVVIISLILILILLVVRTYSKNCRDGPPFPETSSQPYQSQMVVNRK